MFSSPTNNMISRFWRRTLSSRFHAISSKTKTKFLKVNLNFQNKIHEISQKTIKKSDFKKNFAENKWLDFKIVENLFKVLDSLWPEIFPQKTSNHSKKSKIIKNLEFNMEDIQKKIVNLLDYINASEYAKDLEVY